MLRDSINMGPPTPVPPLWFMVGCARGVFWVNGRVWGGYHGGTPWIPLGGGGGVHIGLKPTERSLV